MNDLTRFLSTPTLLLKGIAKEKNERSLITFLRNGWKWIDPAPFIDSWHLDAIAEHLQAVTDGEIRKLIINCPPRHSKSSLVSVAFPAWTWIQETDEDYPLAGPAVQFLSSSYAQNLSTRDALKSRRLIQSPWYQEQWRDRFALTSDQNAKTRYENDKGGYRIATSVGGSTTGEGGSIIMIDDPLNAKDAISEAMITDMVDWWDQTMSTRLNDPKTGAYIVIMQRLSELDLTGHILDHDVAGEWEHLVLPARFESDRRCVTSIGWEDPRTKEGEILSPDRFDDKALISLEASLGTFGCTPYEAPILMANLSMKPIGEVRVGDEIVGFETKKRLDDIRGRRALVKARVSEVHAYTAQVMKMTLDSGEVIRCTADHKWFTKDRGPDRPMYLPAKVGSQLARISPSSLPQIIDPEDLRDAGWLSGFFDGEGSVSVAHKTRQNIYGADYRGSAIVSFYQGDGRNGPLCDKLEVCLTKFGFEFDCFKKDPVRADATHKLRQYRIRGIGLPALQRFLHIVKPTKWRDRIIDGAYGSKYIMGREAVISIEPDGIETVYALTTTTGNYVVWGLASSNSAGQLQQRPSPKGGGIIRRDHWQLWGDEENPENEKFRSFPPMEYILVSADTAYTEKEENDPSAITVWGVFQDATSITVPSPLGEDSDPTKRSVHRLMLNEYAVPRVMLMHCQTVRMGIDDLVATLAKTCRKFKANRLLIEAKASGISAAQMIERLHADENWGVELIEPKGDKVARVYSVEPIFAAGMVFAPWKAYDPVVKNWRIRQWADDVITEFEKFPKGTHDDRVDSSTMSLSWLRNAGMIRLGAELSDDIGMDTYNKGGRSTPLYPS